MTDRFLLLGSIVALAAFAATLPAFGQSEGYKAKDAVYEFEAETIKGRTLKPRLPFRKFRYQQPLMISPPASAQQQPDTGLREKPGKAKGE